jgi:hypothetical protein
MGKVTEAGGLGGESRERQEVETTMMAWEKEGKEIGRGRLGWKRRKGGGMASKVSPSNNHPSTTQTAYPGPTTGSFLTTHAVQQRCKHAQNGEFNKPGFNSGRPQPHSQPTPPQSRHHLAQMLWHFTSIFESQNRH